MPSTDIKDYYRRSWGIGDRQPQKPRLGYVALPLVINPTTIGLVATTLGIAGEAARRYINENPGIVGAAEQGVDKIKEFVSFKKKKEEPSKEVVKVEQEDWSGSFKDKEPDQEPPEDPKWKKGLEIVERATIDTFTDRLKKKVVNFLDKKLSNSENRSFAAKVLNENREIVGPQVFVASVSNQTGEITYGVNLGGGKKIYDKNLKSIIEKRDQHFNTIEKPLRDTGFIPVDEAVELLNKHGVKVRKRSGTGFSEEGAKEMTPKAFGSLANTHKIETMKGPNEHVNWYKLSDIENKIITLQKKNVGVDTKVKIAKNLLTKYPDIKSWNQLNLMLEKQGLTGFSRALSEIHFPELKTITYQSEDFVPSATPESVLQGYRRKKIKTYGAQNVEKVLIAFKKHLGFGKTSDAPAELMHSRTKEKATKSLYNPEDLMFGSKEENREYNMGLEKVRTDIKRALSNIKLKYSPREFKENVSIKVPSNLIRNYDFPEKMPIKKFTEKLNYMTTDLATATDGKISGALFDEKSWDFKETTIGTDWSLVPGFGLTEEKLQDLDPVFKKLRFERKKGGQETGNLMIDEKTGMPLVKNKYKLTKDEAETILLFLSNMADQLTIGAESKPISLNDMKEIWKRIPKKDGGLSGVDNYILNRYR